MGGWYHDKNEKYSTFSRRQNSVANKQTNPLLPLSEEPVEDLLQKLKKNEFVPKQTFEEFLRRKKTGKKLFLNRNINKN